MIFTKLRSLVLAATLLSISLPSYACIHGPLGFDGRVKAGTYAGLVLQQGKRQELILNVDLELDGRPENLAWVVAIPKVPDAYNIVKDAKMFKDLYHVANEEEEPTPGVLTFSDENKLDIKLVKVGPFVIHEIKTEGKTSIKKLNKWLKSKGFASKPEQEMKFFVERKYSFLCINFDLNKAREDANKTAKKKNTTDNNTGLPLLRISFASDRPFFPLKFSSHQGSFNLKLYTLTAKPIDWAGSVPMLTSLGTDILTGTNVILEDPSLLHGYKAKDKDEEESLEKWRKIYQNYVIPSKTLKAMKHFGPVFKKILSEKRIKDLKQWYYCEFDREYNEYIADKDDPGNEIKNWTQDFYLELIHSPKYEEIGKFVRSLYDLPEHKESHFKVLREYAKTDEVALANELMFCRENRVRALLAKVLFENPGAVSEWAFYILAHYDPAIVGIPAYCYISAGLIKRHNIWGIEQLKCYALEDLTAEGFPHLADPKKKHFKTILSSEEERKAFKDKYLKPFTEPNTKIPNDPKAAVWKYWHYTQYIKLKWDPKKGDFTEIHEPKSSNKQAK